MGKKSQRYRIFVLIEVYSLVNFTDFILKQHDPSWVLVVGHSDWLSSPCNEKTEILSV